MIATPPFLLFCALGFWGMRTGMLVPAVMLGGLLESSRWVAFRWEFSSAELRRVWDLCVILVLGALVYLVVSDQASNPFFTLVQWLPLLFTPIMLAQAFGQRDALPSTTFSILLRAGRPTDAEPSSINVSHPYLAVSVLAASAVNEPGTPYLAGLAILAGWALWRARARRVPAAAWVLVFALGFGGSLWLGSGLTRLQAALDGRLTAWVLEWMRQEFDPGESRTSLGQVGRLKQSGRIVLRVESGESPPELLRTASYDLFNNTTWFATRKEFVELTSTTEDGYWKLIANKSPRRAVTVACYLRKGNGVIPLPHGAAELDQLPALRLQTNALGVVRTVQAPGLVRYVARHGPGLSTDCPPDETTDLEVPDTARGFLRELLSGLDLTRAPAETIVSRLADFFQEKFTYSLSLPSAGPRLPHGPSHLERFLLTTRSGHCEYFATAAVLLLREAGIPARYATGYAVQESAGRGRYLVRERHAHAWVIYYDRASETWLEFDPTPAGWAAREAAAASGWEGFRDFFSQIWFALARWRWLADRSTLQNYVLGLLAPLVLILAYRLMTARRGSQRPRRDDNEASRKAGLPGHDSEFYAIEQALAARHLGRLEHETVTDWLRRLQSTQAIAPVNADRLEPICDLHHRLRFDPAGLPESGRAELRQRAREWIDAFHHRGNGGTGTES